MIIRFQCGARRLATVAVLGSALVLVPVVAAAEGSVKLPKSGKYIGKSSGLSAASVTFTISPSGKKITSFVGTLAYNGRCGQGGGPAFSFKVPSMPISAGGRFSATTQGIDNATKGTIQITGIVSNRSAHGSIVEPKPFFNCTPPHQNVNPYSETFTASTK